SKINVYWCVPISFGFKLICKVNFYWYKWFVHYLYILKVTTKEVCLSLGIIDTTLQDDCKPYKTSFTYVWKSLSSSPPDLFASSKNSFSVIINICNISPIFNCLTYVKDITFHSIIQ